MILKSIPFALAFCLTAAFSGADELPYNSADTTATPSATAVKPKPRLDANQDSATGAELSGGSSLTGVGNAMAAGGLVLVLIGNASQSLAPAMVGSIFYSIGVPMVGVGAGRVNRAAERLNPEYRADYRGWGWYWTGFGMGAFAQLILQSVIHDANNAETQHERDEAMKGVGFPILLALGSFTCGIVSWVKFGKLAGEGKRAAREAGSMRDQGQLDILPTLAIMADGSPTPGLHLDYRF